MKTNQWAKIIERYLQEGRTVSGGCSPSSNMKTINNGIQDFAKDVKSQASTIFSGASDVFNTIMNSVHGIIAGGSSQYGYSAGEQAAKMAVAVNAGAAEARNLKGAAASSVGAVGGGNTANPAGIQQETVMGADQKAASDTALAENTITQGGFETGRDNFWKAEDVAGKAPSVFDASTAANRGVTEAQHEAATSQQNMDTQSNWAMNDIMKLGTAAVSGATSGATGGLSGGVGNLGNGSLWDNVKSFGTGFMGGTS